MLLRQGQRSEDVRLLQEALTERGFSVPTTGLFGDLTKDAVRRFQTSVGLTADGIVGPDTQNALYEPVASVPTTKQPTPAISSFEAAADLLGCSVAALRAIAKVESNGNGFLPDGRPKILFERHVFYKQLSQHGLRPGAYVDQSDICSTQTGGYVGGAGEYERLDRAAEISHDAAMESASWGAFQIMGYHWTTLKYASLAEFLTAQETQEGQLDAFVRFLKASPAIVRGMIQEDWASVARAYNGPAYAQNKYDTKLKTEYEALS